MRTHDKDSCAAAGRTAFAHTVGADTSSPERLTPFQAATTARRGHSACFVCRRAHCELLWLWQ